MAGSPFVDQGTLNRLRQSVTIPSVTNLNVTAPYLGKQGITVALDGQAVEFPETLTGTVTSPQPYIMATVKVNLLKTQGLSDTYKKRMETNAKIGDITVRTDTSTLSQYDIINCAIESVDPLSFNGESADYMVTIKGYYQVNTSLYDATS